MTKSRRKWRCLDCKVDTGHEHYMLHDSTWMPVAPKVGMLCVGCVEDRLGRKLVPMDFNDSYLNRPRTGPMSQRLISRMGLDKP